MFQNWYRPINIILRGKAATSLLPSTCCAPFVTVVHSINFSTLSPRSLIPDVVLKREFEGVLDMSHIIWTISYGTYAVVV